MRPCDDEGYSKKNAEENKLVEQWWGHSSENKHKRYSYLVPQKEYNNLDLSFKKKSVLQVFSIRNKSINLKLVKCEDLNITLPYNCAYKAFYKYFCVHKSTEHSAKCTYEDFKNLLIFLLLLQIWQSSRLNTQRTKHHAQLLHNFSEAYLLPWVWKHC